MSEWKEIKLGEVISIKGGFSYKGNHIGKGSSLLLGMGCVSFNQKFLYSGARAYSGECGESYYVKPGDLVLATRQQSDNLPILGLPAIIPNEFKEKRIIVGTNLYMVKNNSEIDNKFLFWLLKSSDYGNHISACAKGTTVRMITKDAVESFKFLCPSKQERDNISDILWSIENKIDLLQRQNKTLEQLAETLFRQWFVEDAEEGWEAGKVLDLFVLQRGHDLPSQNRTQGKYPIMSSGGVNGFHDEYKVKGPGVTTGRSGVIGNVFYITHNFWPLNTSLFIKEYKIGSPLFSYFFLKTLDLKTLNGGSAVPTLNRNDVHDLDTILPPKKVVEKFELIVSDYFKKIELNKEQISSLTRLRDALLPKLMSGEVRVKK